MNTTEKIVESYFRHCLGCFTTADVKVEGGNNRQLDLLAVNLKTDDAYHVEVSVKIAGFAPTLTKLETAFEHKFFGTPRKNEKPTGDHALGKNYRRQVNQTYKRLGLTPSRVQRVYVCWSVKGAERADIDAFCRQFSRRYHLGRNPVQVWSFRDQILPALADAVGTSNYEDDALRTLSLLSAAERQRGRM